MNVRQIALMIVRQENSIKIKVVFNCIPLDSPIIHSITIGINITKRTLTDIHHTRCRWFKPLIFVTHTAIGRRGRSCVYAIALTIVGDKQQDLRREPSAFDVFPGQTHSQTHRRIARRIARQTNVHCIEPPQKTFANIKYHVLAPSFLILAPSCVLCRQLHNNEQSCTGETRG